MSDSNLHLFKDIKESFSRFKTRIKSKFRTHNSRDASPQRCDFGTQSQRDIPDIVVPEGRKSVPSHLQTQSLHSSCSVNVVSSQRQVMNIKAAPEIGSVPSRLPHSRSVPNIKLAVSSTAEASALPRSLAPPSNDAASPSSDKVPKNIQNLTDDTPLDSARSHDSTSRRALSTAKTVAKGVLNFAEMILKRLPDVIDTNPATIATGLIKLVLELKDELKENMDAVDQRIVSTVDQLKTLETAMKRWSPSKNEEKQAIDLYTRALQTEWKNLLSLKEQSFIQRIAAVEKNKGEIAEIFERINQARQQLLIITGIKSYETVLAILDNVQKSSLKELLPSHVANHKYKPGGKEQRLLRRAVCTPGTRVRILNEIIKWANNDSPNSESVFWLFGLAGKGKTTIAYTIARRFEYAIDAADTICLGGNFFCSRQIDEARDSRCIIRTIVYQLALICKPFADAVLECGDFNTVFQDPVEQLEKLLVKPWKRAQSIAASPLRFLIVIDALDEIDRECGPQFLRDLFDCVEQHQLRGLKWFATSRRDQRLVEHVDQLEDKQTYRLEEVPMDEAEADIRTFLDVNLMEFVGSPEMEKFVQQADGLFIYAVTIVRYLQGLSLSEKKGRISRLPQSGVPTTGSTLLDELYLQIVSEAFERVMDDEIDLQRRLGILYTFLCAREPISPSLSAGLFSASAIDRPLESTPSDIADEVLSDLHSVLYVEGGNVFAYHKSFTDFVFEKNRSKEFACVQEQHHRFLALACFHVMHRELKFNITNIESSFFLDAENMSLPDAVHRNISPILRYSCQAWSYHLLAVGLINPNYFQPLHHVLSIFIELPALFWLETMNLLGQLRRCAQMLQDAGKFVAHVYGKSNSELQQMLEEVSSFATYFVGSEAALSTPHLYISALATWPYTRRPCCEWRTNFPNIPHFSNASKYERPLMILDVGIPGIHEIWSTMCMSSQGNLILTGIDNGIVIWDASTGVALKTLEGHIHYVTTVAFSSNDRYVVSGSHDKSVILWDASTGATLKILKGHTDIVTSVAISKNDRYVVSGSQDASVRLWDASTGAALKTLWGHSHEVKSVAFSSDDRYVVSGSFDNTVRLWDPSTGAALKTLRGHDHSVTAVAFSNDDKYVVSASEDSSVRLWDCSTGAALRILEGHTRCVTSVALSSNGKYLVSGSEDLSVILWDVSTGEALKTLQGHTGVVTSVAFSGNDRYIMSGSKDKLVRLWDASTEETLKILEEHTDSVTSVAFSSDDRYIVSGSEDNSVRLWDASTGAALKTLEGHTNCVVSVAFSSDGRCVVSGSYDNSVRLWDASTGAVLKKLKGHTSRVTSVAFSSDDRYVASASWDKTIILWDASTGKELNTLRGHNRYVNSVAFSSDDRYIVSGSEDDFATLWDFSTGAALKKLKHTYGVQCVAFSSDDSYIVSASGDRLVNLWDASTGAVLKKLQGHNHLVASVAFSSNNRYIVSGSVDKTIRLWDASTGASLRILEGHTDFVTSVAFSSDDSYIVSGSYDKSVRLWDVLTDVEISPVEGFITVESESRDQSPGHPAPSLGPSGLRAKTITHVFPRSQNRYTYVREKKPTQTNKDGYTGWLLSPKGEHRLMFVPTTAHLPDESNVLTIPKSQVASVDLSSSTLGAEWHRCFAPIPQHIASS